ncbi:12634_t:CDS:2 [Ambispora gerdemannii]|uniref:12634_t:CDS:1 n=1 Tax=Ambispora gerdemannii TaxID=144530 RepID=A0A9N9G3J9_9GLOM|nr:12634_t:CDS:2 [Ambispora gerdemannii]
MSTISTSTPAIQSPVVTPASPRNIHPNPFDMHEGIPEEQEFEHIAELKRLAAEKARRQTIGTSGEIARGTTASLTQSALGKYSTAIGEEIRAPSLIVQARVKAADHPVDQAQLVRELKEEAEQRRQFELQTQGYVPRAGPAAKVEEAAEQLEKGLKIEEGQLLKPTSQPTSAQQMQEVVGIGVGMKKGIGNNKFDNRGGYKNRGMRNRQQHKYPGTQIPANPNFMRAQNMQRGFQGQQNIQTPQQVDIGNPDVIHEGIPESQEFEHLAHLKKVTVEHARGISPITRGSKAAVAQSALGKYATAISEETRIPTLSVQGLVDPVEHEIDLEKLIQVLRKEVQHRHEFEMQTLGRVLPNGPAVKVGEAVDRLVQSQPSQKLPGDFVSPSAQLTAAGVSGLSQQAGQQEFATQQQVTPPASPAQHVSVGGGQGIQQVGEGAQIPPGQDKQSAAEQKVEHEGISQSQKLENLAESKKISSGSTEEAGLPQTTIQGDANRKHADEG